MLQDHISTLQQKKAINFFLRFMFGQIKFYVNGILYFINVFNQSSITLGNTYLIVINIYL